MKKAILIAVCASALSLGLFAACASVAERVVRNIDVNLSGVQLKLDNPVSQGLIIAGALLDRFTGKSDKREPEVPVVISLQVKNNNAFTVEVSRLTYTLFLNEQEVGSGDKTGEKGTMKIEPGQEKAIDIPIKISSSKMIEETIGGLRDKKLDANVRGKVTVNTYIGELTSPYTSKLVSIKIR